MFKSETKKQPTNTSPLDPTTGSLVLGTNNDILLTMSEPVAESLRYLLARLKSRDEFPAKVALTSALRGEGVTYISQSLGTVMANDFPEKICVVELNWCYPSQQSTNSNGIAGIIRGECTLEEALVATNYPNLSLIPAGRVSTSERPILVNSQRLADTIAEISNHFDYVLLDLPAVLSTSEVIPLISLADAALFVLRHGSASFDKLERAIEDINHVQVLGAVMNQVELTTPQWMLKFMPRA